MVMDLFYFAIILEVLSMALFAMGFMLMKKLHIMMKEMEWLKSIFLNNIIHKAKEINDQELKDRAEKMLQEIINRSK